MQLLKQLVMEKRQKDAKEAEEKAALEAAMKSSSSSSILSEDYATESDVPEPEPSSLRDKLKRNTSMDNIELLRAQTFLKPRGLKSVFLPIKSNATSPPTSGYKENPITEQSEQS